MKDIRKLTCPECNQEIEYEMYSTVNVTLDKSMREKVLSGDLFKVECPKCGHIEFAGYPLLYHDQDHMFMVQYTSKEEKENILKGLKDNAKKTEEIIGKNYRNYHVRVCDEFPAFVEKVMCLETDIDDRILEIFRVYVIQMLYDQKQLGEKDRIYLYKEEEGFRIDLIDHENDSYKTFHIKNEAFIAIENEYKDRLDKEEYDIAIIDYKWVHDYIEKLVKSLN